MGSVGQVGLRCPVAESEISGRTPAIAIALGAMVWGKGPELVGGRSGHAALPMTAASHHEVERTATIQQARCPPDLCYDFTVKPRY